MTGSVTTIGGPAAWAAGDLDIEQTVVHVDDLPSALVEELRAAARVAPGSVPRGAAAANAARDVLTASFAAGAFTDMLNDVVFAGNRVVVLRGLPVSPQDAVACEAMLTAMLAAVGSILPQNVEGDSVYTVIDRSDPRGFYGGSRATGALLYHTDQAAAPEPMLPDILALWCLEPAVEGGETLLASGYALHDALVADAPELAASLYDALPFARDADGVSAAAPLQSPVFRDIEGHVRVRYNEYFVARGATDTGVELHSRHRAALDRCEELLASGGLSVTLRLDHGDLLLVDNSVVLHNRNAYRDADDGTRKRTMLRGWARRDTGSTTRKGDR